MCGILGYKGKILRKRKMFLNFLGALFISSEDRGIDSTGFSCIYQNGKVITDKLPVRASSFIRLSENFLKIGNPMPVSFIGHTRRGTRSSNLINANNHPFYDKRFDMVHNGVVPSFLDVKEKLNLDIHSNTDSEVILRQFSKVYSKKQSYIKSVENVLNNIWGNMAVAILDKVNKNLVLFRNHNPIVLAKFNSNIFGPNVYVFCSTIDILKRAFKLAFSRNLSNEYCKVFSLLKNHIYILPDKKIIRKDKKYTICSYELKVKKPFSKTKQYYYTTSPKIIYSKFDKNLTNTIDNFKSIKKNAGSKTLFDGLELSKYLELNKIVKDFIK